MPQTGTAPGVHPIRQNTSFALAKVCRAHRVYVGELLAEHGVEWEGERGRRNVRTVGNVRGNATATGWAPPVGRRRITCARPPQGGARPLTPCPSGFERGRAEAAGAGPSDLPPCAAAMSSGSIRSCLPARASASSLRTGRARESSSPRAPCAPPDGPWAARPASTPCGRYWGWSSRPFKRQQVRDASAGQVRGGARKQARAAPPAAGRRR